MDTPDFKTFLNLIGALLVSIGGASVVILALGKWFGDFLSERLLDTYKNKHEKSLEDLKSLYSKELEATKSELEKTKASFLRYSEKQFTLYNDLWKILLYTKNQADQLWAKPTPDKIPSFSEQIRLTRSAVNDNMLLIEESHYEDLDKLMKEFETFMFGKLKLVDLSDFKKEDIDREISQQDVTHAINSNRATRDRYDELIMKIGRSFRIQIKG